MLQPQYKIFLKVIHVIIIKYRPDGQISLVKNIFKVKIYLFLNIKKLNNFEFKK